jgi:phenylalanyl-tRNA synthetase alpha subunit
MATPDQPSPIVVEELHNDIQRALAITVNDMLAEGLRGDDALDRIFVDIQPAVLFHPDLRPYSKFYRQVRDIFLSLGVNVDSRRGYPIIKALVCVYPECSAMARCPVSGIA